MAPKKGKEEKKEEIIQEVVEESGTYMFPEYNGKYTGQVIRRDGHLLRNGAGVFSDDFLQYDGTWREDLMHGEGSILFKHDKSTYKGSFVDSQFDGFGTYLWSDGSRYEGQWRFNRMHGEGQFYDKDGVLWQGKYYNGTGPGLRRSIGLS